MDLKTVLRIQLITLIDSFCFGLIYAFINPYLLIVGGDHLTVGIFSVMTLLCQIMSPDITTLITYQTGKQFSLFLVSVIAVISHLLITLTNSSCFIILSRCLFTITNQTNGICRQVLLKKIPKDETEYFLSVQSILGSFGYIFGPIVTGCLFSYGFSYTCWLAAILTFLNVYLTTTLVDIDDDDDDKISTEEPPLMEKITSNVAQVVNNFKDSNLEENWDIISLKFFFTSSISIFFSKFTQILKYNFDSDAVAIGSTTSYMNGLAFAGSYLISDFIAKSESSKLSLMPHSLSLLLISLLSACYAPTFPLYLIICVPMIFSRCYLNSTWAILFTSRKNEALKNVNESVGIIAGLIVPIFFGITCDQIGHHAVVLFSVVPILLSLFVFNQRLISSGHSQESLKSKDE